MSGMSNAERDSALGTVQRWRATRREWNTSGGQDRDKFPPSWPLSYLDTARLIAVLPPLSRCELPSPDGDIRCALSCHHDGAHIGLDAQGSSCEWKSGG